MSTVGTWTLPPASPATLGSGSLSEQLEKRQTTLLGRDIWFEGDYAVNQVGDWLEVVELPALKAAIYRRLITRPGDFRARPSYGVGVADYVKRRNAASTVDELRVAIIDQLSLEERIDEVLDVTTQRVDDGLRVQLTIRATGRTVKFAPLDFSERDLLSLARTSR